MVVKVEKPATCPAALIAVAVEAFPPSVPSDTGAPVESVRNARVPPFTQLPVPATCPASLIASAALVAGKSAPGKVPSSVIVPPPLSVKPVVAPPVVVVPAIVPPAFTPATFTGSPGAKEPRSVSAPRYQTKPRGTFAAFCDVP